MCSSLLKLLNLFLLKMLIVVGCLDLMERGTVEWNSGTVE